MLGIVVVMRKAKGRTIPCEMVQIYIARIVLSTLFNVGIQMKHTTSRTGTRKQLLHAVNSRRSVAVR